MYASTAPRHNWSIISTAAGTMPAAMMSLTVPAPSSTVVKSISSVCTVGRVRRELHAHLGRDAEHPLAADEHAAEVVPVGLRVLAAEHR